MTGLTLSSHELNQDVTRAKRAAQSSPVFITDRRRPAHVLLSFETYQQLTQQRRNIANALCMPQADTADFDPPRAEVALQATDFS